jgi:GGDEF domain-containing protein
MKRKEKSPIDPLRANSVKANPVKKSHLVHEKILVVDDEEVLRSFTDEVLTEGFWTRISPHEAFQPNGKLTVSLGVAEYPRDGEEVAILLQHVDEAMYRAKETGKNKVCNWTASAEAGSSKTIRCYLN